MPGAHMKILACRGRNSQRGAAQIEFALSILLTMFLIFWMFEMIMVVYTYSVLADAAKEGVRYAIVHGSNNGSPSGPKDDDPAITSVVNGYAKLSLHNISSINIHTTYPETSNDPPHMVKVDVTYTYVPYIALPFTYPSIHTTAQGRSIN